MSARDRLGRMPVHSPDIEEILSAVPSRLVRHGIAAICATTLLLFGVAWWIRYPEVLIGRVTLVSRQPPVPVVARRDGRIARLFVKEGDRVKRGDLLAALDSSAVQQDMFALEERLEALRHGDSETIETVFPPDARLGEHRGLYATFLQAREDLRRFRSQDTHERRIAAVRAQAAAYARLGSGLRAQTRLLADSATLAREEEDADQKLQASGALARSSARETRRRLLQEEAELRGVAAGQLRNDALITELRRQALELEQDRVDRLRALERAVREASQTLASAVATWRYDFVLVAPTDGVVSMFDVWSGDQLVRAGKEALFVVPESQELIGRLSVAQRGMGRAQPGHRVRVWLDSYPVHQFGAVDGQVASISRTARGDEYLVDVAFPTGLRTTFGRELPFRQGMTGAASIVTEDIRLLVRLIAPLRHLLTSSARGS